jgi:hypothetical protein
MVHPFQDLGTLGIISGKWRSAIPHNHLEKKFFKFEELLERMFMKEVEARADINEVLSCLHAILSEDMLPHRPQHRLEALEKVSSSSSSSSSISLCVLYYFK